MDPNRSQMTGVLNLTLEIIYMLTGEDYTVVRKTTRGRNTSDLHGPEALNSFQNTISEGPSHPLLQDRNDNRKILELTNKIIHLLTGEVWQYLEGHTDVYKYIVMENHQLLTSLETKKSKDPDLQEGGNYVEKETSTPADLVHIKEEPNSYDGGSVSDNCTTPTPIKLEPVSCEEAAPSRITGRMDKSHVIKTILHLTVDIIYLLTGEEYRVIKQRSGERLVPSRNAYMLLRRKRTQSRIQENCNEQEILELTNKIIQLLSGEAEDLIDIKVEVLEKEELFVCDQKFEEEIKTDESPRCPSPLHVQDPSNKEHNRKDADNNIAQNGSTANHYQKIDPTCKQEDIPTDISTADGHYRIDTHEESFMLPSKPGTEDIILQCSPSQNAHLTPVGSGSPCPNTTDSSEEMYIPLRDEYSITVTLQQENPEEEKPYNCPECGKRFTKKSSLSRHQIIHVGEKPFSCTLCSKSFARKSTLVEHEKTHTCEKPYSCSDCGKCFGRKANLVDHRRIHTGEKSFLCPVCGKCFTNKTILVRHQKSHSGEKPFSCLECGKRFGHKSVLVKHQIVHTGEKPYPCSECGKCFTQKGNLMEHQKIHTGERPFFCSYCGKYFTNRAVLMRHQATHAKQRPFSCSGCGKCFMHKAYLIKHERSHMVQEILSCKDSVNVNL
ncbi:uncharacterized protein [Engystomops pustulosus]|uniref:uncharacterized protein isoform X2 n=1 Tax=Engystomops pustulosus TaxID=76066 RepID=UPI003AFAB3AA